MEAEFWHNRWAKNAIGFHQPDVNPLLVKHWPTLGLEPGCRILVPLCGKSQDMLWLLAQGYGVVGIEFSQLAAKAFFAENAIVPRLTRETGFTRWSSGGLELLCGDFFDIKASDIGLCDGFYDRAALVALPADMRKDYAEHVTRLSGQSARGLLVTFDYNQEEMCGPPFSVPGSEVNQLFADQWNIHRLSSHDNLKAEGKFRERGLSRLEEQAFSLVRV